MSEDDKLDWMLLRSESERVASFIRRWVSCGLGQNGERARRRLSDARGYLAQLNADMDALIDRNCE